MGVYCLDLVTPGTYLHNTMDIHCMKHYLLFAFSIHQKPIGSSSVTEVHISSAFDEKKMIFHLLNIQKDNKIQTFSFCQNKKVIFHLS
jgi:hypothetical protein